MSKKNSLPKPTPMGEVVFDALPTMAQVDESAETGFGTALALSKIVDMFPGSVGRHLRRLRAQERAHIYRYTDEPKPCAVWVTGAGKDADRPVRTPAEIVQRRRDISRRTMAKARERQKAGRPPSDPNLTPHRELVRTMSTIARAMAAPRSWIGPLVEAQELAA